MQLSKGVLMPRRLLSAAALFAALPAYAADPSSTPTAPANAAALALNIAAETSASNAQTATIAALSERLRRLEQQLARSQPPSPAPSTSPADSSTNNNTDTLVALDQRLRIIERQLELQQEDATAKAASVPVVTVNDKGLSARNAKGDFEIKLRGTVQADQRLFFGDNALPQNDTFLFRLVRPTLEGSLGSLVGFRITPDFAGDSATLVDAYVDLRFNPAYTLRVGKFTSPIGLERLQSSSSTASIERGFPTELAPNRDLGVQLQGELAAGRINYALGVFNGAPDGRDAPTIDGDDHFEAAARIFFEPWKNSANAWSGFGFGIAASQGEKEGAGNNFLPRYRTPGQNQFFAYRSTVLADGSHTRFSPQAYYYRNAFGLLGEYISSRQELALNGKPTTRITLRNDAWQLTGSWVLTGEDASYRGVVKPAHPFEPGGNGWGAFELVARYGELDIDDRAFPLYADAATSASNARAWGLGLNWYLTSNLKLVFNHSRAHFAGGAAKGADREDEKTFFSRVQVSF